MAKARMSREERYIAQEIDSTCVSIQHVMEYPPEGHYGPPKPAALNIMAYLGDRRVAVHLSRLPLRPNWMSRAIAHFISERERA